MIRLPKKIKLPQGPVTIKRRSVITNQGEPCMAKWNPNNRTITIKWGVDDIEVLELLVHELLHQALKEVDEDAIAHAAADVAVALMEVLPWDEDWNLLVR